MGLCAVSRWCEGCRNNGKGQLSSAFDRISERITLAFQTLSRLEAIRGQPSKNEHSLDISIRGGGEGVSQPPLKGKAFSIFRDQNPPFELRPGGKFFQRLEGGLRRRPARRDQQPP